MEWKKEINLIFFSLSHSSRPTSSSERRNYRHHHRSPYWSHFAAGHNWNGDSNVPQTPQQQAERRVSASLPSRAWITAAQQQKKKNHWPWKIIPPAQEACLCGHCSHKTTVCVFVCFQWSTQVQTPPTQEDQQLCQQGNSLVFRESWMKIQEPFRVKIGNA